MSKLRKLEWERDMQRARALAGVILLDFSEQKTLECVKELNRLKSIWGARYDPSGFGQFSEVELLTRKVTRESGTVPGGVNISIARFGSKPPSGKSRKGSRSTT